MSESSEEFDLLIEKALMTNPIISFDENEMFTINKNKVPTQCSKRKRDSREVARQKRMLASVKSRNACSDMIEVIYSTLPEIFNYHSSFIKITKIQKLDRIQKFVLSVQKHGYKAD